jgi:hypothetical protein
MRTPSKNAKAATTVPTIPERVALPARRIELGGVAMPHVSAELCLPFTRGPAVRAA